MEGKKVDKKDYLIDGVFYKGEEKENIDRIRKEQDGIYLSDDVDAVRVRKWFQKRYENTTKGMWLLQLAVMLRVVNSEYDGEDGKAYREWQRLDTNVRKGKEKKVRRLINQLRNKLCFDDFLPVKLGMKPINKKGKIGEELTVLGLLNRLQLQVDLAAKISRTTHKKGISERYYSWVVNVYFRMYGTARMPNKVITSVVCLRFSESEVTEYDIKNWRYAGKKAWEEVEAFKKIRGAQDTDNIKKLLIAGKLD